MINTIEVRIRYLEIRVPREPSLSCQVKDGFITERVNILCVKGGLCVLYIEKK